MLWKKSIPLRQAAAPAPPVAPPPEAPAAPAAPEPVAAADAPAPAFLAPAAVGMVEQGMFFFGHRGLVGGLDGSDSWKKWGKFVDKTSFSACRFFKMWDELCLLFLICSLGSAECQARPPLGASLVSAPLRVFILYV